LTLKQLVAILSGMNHRQLLAFENPSPRDPRAFDEISSIEGFSVITRLICQGPGNGSFGNWLARATVLTESGESISTIWLPAEAKTAVTSMLKALFAGVGHGEIHLLELANSFSAARDLRQTSFSTLRI
jgi:hypothetical protein